MKKLLILILIALLLLLGFFIVIQGVQIGNLGILGIKGIQAKDVDVDSKVQEANSLVQTDYAALVNEIEQNSDSFETAKKDYEDKVTINEGGEVEDLNKPYDIETLWVRVGNHATRQGVIMNMDVGNGSDGSEGTYDLHFTATGSYISITDFISAIENDSTLGFKIEEFKMVPSGSELQATFTCKNISINKKELNQQIITTTNETNTENNTNATNSSNTTNTTNTTDNTTANTTDVAE